jgi:hypothetical protein
MRGEEALDAVAKLRVRRAYLAQVARSLLGSEGKALVEKILLAERVHVTY